MNPTLYSKFIQFLAFQMVSDLKIRETSEADDGSNNVGIFGQVMVTATVLDKLESKIPARK